MLRRLKLEQVPLLYSLGALEASSQGLGRGTFLHWGKDQNPEGCRSAPTEGKYPQQTALGLLYESQVDHLGDGIEAVFSPPIKTVGSREVASKLTWPHSWKSFRPGPAPSVGSSWGHLPALHLDPGLFVYLVYKKAMGERRTLLAAKAQEARERRKTEGGWSWGLRGAM